MRGRLRPRTFKRSNDQTIKRGFANVWQNGGGFAKHWQNAFRARQRWGGMRPEAPSAVAASTVATSAPLPASFQCPRSGFNGFPCPAPSRTWRTSREDFSPRPRQTGQFFFASVEHRASFLDNDRHSARRQARWQQITGGECAFCKKSAQKGNLKRAEYLHIANSPPF